MSRLKIAIVHPWERAKWTEPVQWDGLHAALAEVGKRHDVVWFLEGDGPDNTFDWILPWGVGSLPFNNTVEKFKGRKALLCAGHPQDTANFDKFEAIFVESPKVYEEIRRFGYRTILAFGTDTHYFTPMNMEKVYDAFFPATYSPWKRQDLFAEATRGYKALTCGLVQPDGIDLYNKCNEAGGYTLAGLVPSKLISRLYNMGKVCVVTAWHGSERTVLEAMASNIPLVITRDNILVRSIIYQGVENEVCVVSPTIEGVREGFLASLTKKVHTREFVLSNYSEDIYAKMLLKVLES